VFIANVFSIDLPATRKVGRHALYEEARFGIHPGTGMQTTLRTRNEQHAQGTLLLGFDGRCELIRRRVWRVRVEFG
jgi:hypothetical protein